MIRNTETSYGSISKWMHWLTAILILAAYVSIYYLHWFFEGEGPQRFPIIRLHKAIGFSILVLVVLRLYWRMSNPHPRLPTTMPNWQLKASAYSHFMLYFLLIATPVSGYLGNTAGVNFVLFNIPSLKDVAGFIWLLDQFGLTYKEFEVPFDFFHYQIAGPLMVWIMIAIHISAALYHHYVEKDDVLERMLPSRR